MSWSFFAVGTKVEVRQQLEKYKTDCPSFPLARELMLRQLEAVNCVKSSWDNRDCVLGVKVEAGGHFSLSGGSMRVEIQQLQLFVPPLSVRDPRPRDVEKADGGKQTAVELQKPEEQPACDGTDLPVGKWPDDGEAPPIKNS